MKKILLLGTGGTIACVPSEDGLIPALDGEKMLELVPQLQGLCEIDCLELMNLDSSNLEPKHWQAICQALLENYAKYDGFVITHGTDTMAYTAAALSWMLKNVQKPIILTGAQLPIAAEGTDAKANVYYAFKAAVSELKGVVQVFGDRIIHGLCTKKMYTENFNGFCSINRPALAELKNGQINWSSLEGAAVGAGEFAIDTALEERVAVIKLIPGLKPEVLDYFVAAGYKGLVLESFGAGGVPNEQNNWLPAVEKAIKAGVRVVCATQCIYDGVDLTKYPMGVLAQRLGAESAGELTVEAAVTKLMKELA